MKTAQFLITLLIITFYVSFYNKVRAESHEKREKPQFIFPVGCSYGKNCWVVNYVDVDPAEDMAKDFKCNRKTYDGHKGTDFALGSVAQMNEGVDVLAAASGRILRVRDSEDDVLKTPEEIKKIKSK